MNTSNIFKSILPKIEKHIRYGMTLDFGESYGDNNFDYDEDGWNISFGFNLRMTASGSKGIVYGLEVEHYDEDAEKETVFSEEEIKNFREDLEYILRDLA